MFERLEERFGRMAQFVFEEHLFEIAFLKLLVGLATIEVLVWTAQGIESLVRGFQ